MRVISVRYARQQAQHCRLGQIPNSRTQTRQCRRDASTTRQRTMTIAMTMPAVSTCTPSRHTRRRCCRGQPTFDPPFLFANGLRAANSATSARVFEA